MITFNKSEQNRIVVTLTENSTVSNPVYLFEFKNQQSGLSYYFIAPDVSAYKQRYNEFYVTETTNADTIDAEVELGNEGFYDYNVYQTNLVQPINFYNRVISDNGNFESYTCWLNELNQLQGITTANDAIQYITKLVETGLVWVVPSASTQTDYEPQPSQTIIYNG